MMWDIGGADHQTMYSGFLLNCSFGVGDSNSIQDRRTFIVEIRRFNRQFQAKIKCDSATVSSE